MAAQLLVTICVYDVIKSTDLSLVYRATKIRRHNTPQNFIQYKDTHHKRITFDSQHKKLKKNTFEILRIKRIEIRFTNFKNIQILLHKISHRLQVTPMLSIG